MSVSCRGKKGGVVVGQLLLALFILSVTINNIIFSTRSMKPHDPGVEGGGKKKDPILLR